MNEGRDVAGGRESSFSTPDYESSEIDHLSVNEQEEQDHPRAKEELQQKLQRLISDMDVPELRRNDIGWLSRNLGFRNQEHPNFAEALECLKKIRKMEADR